MSYSFANLCGAPYEGGNLTFSSDGSSLAVPCGNRVSIYDLQHNKVITLPFEARQDIKHLIFAPNSPLLLTIDETGRCLVINFIKGVVLNRIYFKAPVSAAKFSPCGLYFAVTIDRKLKIWDTPTAQTGWQLSLRREIRQHLDQIVSLDWSMDSQFIVTASKDLTVKVFSRDPIEGFSPTTFVDHRYPLRAAYFTKDMKRIISVSRDGALISWRWWPDWEAADHEEEEGESIRERGHHLTYKWKGKAKTEEKEEIKTEDETRRTKRRKVESQEEDPEQSDSLDQEVNDQEMNDKSLNDSSSTKDQSDTESESTISGKFPSYIHGKWSLEKKVFCNSTHQARVARCNYHVHNGLLVLGFSNGVIGLYDCPSFDSLYTLSIGSDPIDSVAINNDGEWLAIGAAELGQLVVWEWRSETYLLKQQGHKWGVRCVATAPTVDSGAVARGMQFRGSTLGMGQKGLVVATGGEDGKIKLWDTDSGFNFMTFPDHTAAVNAITFTPQGNAVLSASSDGSVRAFDLTRYRNFRTFTAEESGVQFVAIAVDGGGELVVAGCQGADYGVLVWSIQTGKLLEKLSGHQAPVVSVQFHPHPSKPGVLLSGSLDSTIRVWDVFGRVGKGGAAEPLINSSGVLSVAFDPRANNQLAAATFSGNIWIWDCEEGSILGSIDGLRDIHSGRKIGDKFSANNSRAMNKKNRQNGSVGAGVNQNQHFSSVTYSSNGLWILASSKFSARVCVYDTDRRSLLHTFQLTRNLSLDGIMMELNSKLMTETGHAIDEFDLSDSEDDEFAREKKRIAQHMSLPGANRGQLMNRKKARTIECWQLSFAQNGEQWCVATSHGLFVYSVDPTGGATTAGQSKHISQGLLDRFSPNLITRNVTPQNIMMALEQNEFSKAMILALSLNDFRLLNNTYVSIPYKAIPIVVQSIPALLIPALLNFLRVCLSDPIKRASGISGSPFLQLHLRWLNAVFTSQHLLTLQQLDPTLFGQTAPEESIALMATTGVSGSELRSLCLLLLRNVQRVHSNLTASFASNLHSLDFILSAKP